MAAGQGFASMPPGQHRMASSIGGLRRWARVNTAEERRRAFDAANSAMRSKWTREADPDGVLPPDELEAAVARLKTAHYRLMALRSAQARRGKRATA